MPRLERFLKIRNCIFRLNHVDRLEASLFDHELLILVRKEEFEEPAESCIKVCIVSCFIHPKFFCQSGLILKVKALF